MLQAVDSGGVCITNHLENSVKCVTDALLYPWLCEGRLTETKGEIAVKWLSFVSCQGHSSKESFKEPGSKLLEKYTF